jgi:DNA (cytosine-5)-methyltransferase 1
MKPLLLDLFCGAGGAAMGYHQAGFEVIGVDIKPIGNYPFAFIQGDAIEKGGMILDRHYWPWLPIAAIHASPPCQAHSNLRAMHPKADYPDLIPATRELLKRSRLPYVIENVPGAPLEDPTLLCGSMFGLGCGKGDLRRHRLFETNWPATPPGRCQHRRDVPTVGVYGHGGHSGKHRMLNAADARVALGIDWMNRDEMAQSIPPAYTEHVGAQLLAHLGAR